MKKIIFLLFLISIFINTALAESPRLIEIQNIDKSQEFTYENNIFTQITTLDNTDRITEIKIYLSNSNSNNTAIALNFSNNITFFSQTNKFNFLGIIPYVEVKHYAIFINEGVNYSLFNQTKTHLNIIPTDLIVYIKYDINSGNTTFTTVSSLNILDNLEYSTKNYLGMPSNNIILNGLTTFTTKITVKDIYQDITLKSKKEKLSSISKFIYDVFTLKIPFTDIKLLDENDTLLMLLTIFDIFIFVSIILYSIIFVYPFLMLFIIVTLGNYYSTYQANDIKEFIFYLGQYYKFVINLFYNIIRVIIDIFIKLFIGIMELIGGIIP